MEERQRGRQWETEMKNRGRETKRKRRREIYSKRDRETNWVSK